MAASLPDLPHNVPRIVEVIEPLAENGIHMVHVRMPTQLEAKWPKLPWQTTIETIGITGPDAVKFADYVLVDTQAMKGTPDLLWVFTKLPGKVVTESTWDHELQAQVKRTQQYVAPPVTPGTVTEEDPDPFAATNTSFKKVYWGMSLKEVEVAPTDALDAYVSSIPRRVNLGDLPRELTAVNIVWNTAYSIGVQNYWCFSTASGTSGSVANSANDRDSSSASVSADVQLTFRDLATGNLWGTEYEFYLPNPVTSAAVLAKLNAIINPTEDPLIPDVAFWPVFHPRSETITATGQSVRLAANVNVSLAMSWSQSSSSDSRSAGDSTDTSTNLQTNSVQLPPCIHGPIVFTGATAMSQPVAATATMNLWNSRGGNVSSTSSLTGVAEGLVTPQALTSTGDNNTIPSSGLYLMDMNPQRVRWDYSRITAVVFDATNLA